MRRLPSPQPTWFSWEGTRSELHRVESNRAMGKKEEEKKKRSSLGVVIYVCPGSVLPGEVLPVLWPPERMRPLKGSGHTSLCQPVEKDVVESMKSLVQTLSFCSIVQRGGLWMMGIGNQPAAGIIRMWNCILCRACITFVQQWVYKSSQFALLNQSSLAPHVPYQLSD